MSAIDGLRQDAARRDGVLQGPEVAWAYMRLYREAMLRNEDLRRALREISDGPPRWGRSRVLAREALADAGRDPGPREADFEAWRCGVGHVGLVERGTPPFDYPPCPECRLEEALRQLGDLSGRLAEAEAGLGSSAAAEAAARLALSVYGGHQRTCLRERWYLAVERGGREEGPVPECSCGWAELAEAAGRGMPDLAGMVAQLRAEIAGLPGDQRYRDGADYALDNLLGRLRLRGARA